MPVNLTSIVYYTYQVFADVTGNSNTFSGIVEHFLFPTVIFIEIVLLMQL